MVKIIKSILSRYSSVILYGLFGILTTLLNVIAYHIAYEYANYSNVVATCIAWFFAVAFAFVTNKLFVFGSKSLQLQLVIFEAVKFFGCRIGTGIIEVGCMYVFVDVLQANGTVMKLITNFIVIVLNYILSKVVIFKKGVD